MLFRSTTVVKVPEVVVAVEKRVEEKKPVVVVEKKEKVVKAQSSYVWPEQKASGIRVIKTWADGSQLLDDGKERWMNEMWSQPVKYVCR